MAKGLMCVVNPAGVMPRTRKRVATRITTRTRKRKRIVTRIVKRTKRSKKRTRIRIGIAVARAEVATVIEVVAGAEIARIATVGEVAVEIGSDHGVLGTVRDRGALTRMDGSDPAVHAGIGAEMVEAAVHRPPLRKF